MVSVNPQVNPDIVAMIGASAALSLSGIPFNGPIGAARVGYINDQYVLNPTTDELKESRLDLVVAGTAGAVLMVESEADVLSEDQMLGAVVFGHDQQQVVIENINALVAEAGKPKWDWQAPAVNEALHARVAELAEARTGDAYHITENKSATLRLTRSKTASLKPCWRRTKRWTPAKSGTSRATSRRTWCAAAYCVASRVSTAVKRHDPWHGRAHRRTAAHPRFRAVHPWRNSGAGYRDHGHRARRTEPDELMGEKTDSFLFHYNFPPYSVGETGMVGSPKRREIGHGRPAKRGVLAMMPKPEDFRTPFAWCLKSPNPTVLLPWLPCAARLWR